MTRFHKLKAAASPVSAGVLTAFSATPAFADGFQRANTVMEKVSTGLHGLAAITITVAVIWVGRSCVCTWLTRHIHGVCRPASESSPAVR